MRSVVLAAITIVVALLLGTGVAFAAAISGTQGDDTLRGTQQRDQIYGLNGADKLYGLGLGDELYGGAGRDVMSGAAGNDALYGGSGRDRLAGGPGRDYLNSTDHARGDIVNCGADDNAVDQVIMDPGDTDRDCNNSEVIEVRTPASRS